MSNLINKKLVYQITLIRHFDQCWQIFLHSFILVLIPAYFLYAFGRDSLTFAISAASIAFLLVFIPHLFIHIKYYILNKGMTIEFNVKSRTIKVMMDGGEEVLVKNQDIENVETIVSRAKFKNTLQWYPWDNYSYSIIHLKSGEKILVTSLLIPHLVWPFKLARESITPSFFCWPNQ